MAITRIHQGLFIGFIFLMAKTVWAQTPEEVFDAYFDDWYQVEMVIFERIETFSEDPEVWQKNITLEYPGNHAFLSLEDKSQEDEQEQNDDSNRELLETLKKGDTQDPLTKKILSRIEQSELDRITPKEPPFTKLPRSARKLNEEAKILGRNQQMRLLFHEAWRQPMLERDLASNIVITGGDAFAENFELEGTIKLYLSRYLHLNSNLWLARFDANVGQVSEAWPLIPLRPQPEVEKDESEIEFDVTKFSNETDSGSALEYKPSNSDSLFSIDSNLDDNLLGAYTSFTSSFAEKPFLVTHLVALKQNRRMRSDELHYIDHPKLGLLIRIDKYLPKFTPPDDTSEEAEEAEAQ